MPPHMIMALNNRERQAAWQSEVLFHLPTLLSHFPLWDLECLAITGKVPHISAAASAPILTVLPLKCLTFTKTTRRIHVNHGSFVWWGFVYAHPEVCDVGSFLRALGNQWQWAAFVAAVIKLLQCCHGYEGIKRNIGTWEFLLCSSPWRIMSRK